MHESLQNGGKDQLIDAGTQLSIQTSLVRKRRNIHGNNELNSDDENSLNQNASENVFMNRQKNKVLRVTE